MGRTQTHVTIAYAKKSCAPFDLDLQVIDMTFARRTSHFHDDYLRQVIVIPHHTEQSNGLDTSVCH